MARIADQIGIDRTLRVFLCHSVFDPETFLARAGLGKQVLNLKKNETAYAQGDPADAIFYVRRAS